MKRTFNFGKIAYGNRSGRRINAVDVTIELKDVNGHLEFTASGDIWNMPHTDIVRGGQCLDTIKRHVKDDTFNEIYRLWKKYHLNCMHAGTVEQENALDKAVAEGKLENRYASNYDKCCEYLKSIGMYEVEYEGKPYRYGTGWIPYDIPETDLNKIKELING